MNSNERAVLENSFKKTIDLFKRRNAPEDWARNLRDGSSELKTNLQWKHFYTFIANPTKYKSEDVCLKTAEQEHRQKVCITPYEDCFKIKEWKNGSETIINITNPGLDMDEKKEE